MRRLLAITVGITLLVLPLATLLLLQLRFLAYQDEAVTWAQRVAVWFDVALVITLWPVIMDRGDSWRDYLRRVGSCLHRRWRIGLARAAVWVGFVLPGFVTTADLRYANLQGAKLLAAELQGADLTGADLYGAIHLERGTALVDVRGASWIPLTEERLAQMREVLTKTEALERIERAGKAGLPPPILKSCLIDPVVTPELNCKEKWLPGQIDTFRSELFPVLGKLACQSAEIARGLILQIDPSDTTSGRFGLAGRFAVLLNKQECEGISSLQEADKNQIRYLTKIEQILRGQLEASNPAGEASASPDPPPAIAPATP